MKKLVNMLGVTLLEVMLVLAVAAMIIMMSVKYYQSASTNQNVAAFMNFIQGVTAAADSLAQGTGTYSSASVTDVQSLMPNNSFVLPWGTTASLSLGSSTWVLTTPTVPSNVCTQVRSRYQSNTKYTIPSGCANVTYNNAS